MNIPKIPTNTRLELPRRGSWPATWHIFDEADGSADALLMAWAAERSLLVRGEPGTGKSQLARAAAEVLGRLFVAEVVDARSEPQDLKWRFDAISRLGEAQACGMKAHAADTAGDPLDPRRFINPGVLWWVFDWTSAAEQHDRHSRHKLYRPQPPEGWNAEQGCVLLIDEIDKADGDLPNGLLETLGNRSFNVPWIDREIGQREGQPTPLVVITTNEERELPAAFVRRCLVLNLSLPANLTEWLVGRARIHFPDAAQCSDNVLEKAAEQLAKDREAAKLQGVTPPGQAEYLDLIKALTTLDREESAQLKRLDQLSRFALQKYPQ